MTWQYENRLARNRDWYSHNREKVAAQRKRTRAKNPEKYKASQKARREANPSQHREYNKRAYDNARKNKPFVKAIVAARHRAAKKNIEYNLSTKWAENRYTGRCELSGLLFETGRSERFGPRQRSISIDRVDPTKGYTEDNCRFILFGLNALKCDTSDDKVLEIVRAVIDNMLMYPVNGRSPQKPAVPPGQ